MKYGFNKILEKKNDYSIMNLEKYLIKVEKHFNNVSSYLLISKCDLWIFPTKEYEADYYSLNLSSIDEKLFETDFRKIYIWL